MDQSVDQINIECLKQNNRMGNHIPAGLPPLLAKNWQSIPNHPNSFRNKLTSQYTHKHIINIENPLQIESFKLRMKETNPYVCRVLFYHQYHQSIYHVYTDQTHVQLTIGKQQFWRLHKIKIVQAFAYLAQIYGFMKVCKQMIGADSNDHPKVWIHPDPVAARPWLPCNSESIMLQQILGILQSIEQKYNQKQQRASLNRQPHSQQYQTFEQYIQKESQMFRRQQSFQPRSIANRSSAILQHAVPQNNKNIIASQQGSFHINQHNEHRKKQLNKTYAFNSQVIDEEKCRGMSQQYTKINKLQKIFNPVICETSRDEEQYHFGINRKPRLNNTEYKMEEYNSQSYLTSKRPITQATNPNYNNRNRTNLSLERPTSYNEKYYAVPKESGNKTIMVTTTARRRQTQNFKNMNGQTEQAPLISKQTSKSNQQLFKSRSPQPFQLQHKPQLMRSQKPQSIPVAREQERLKKLLQSSNNIYPTQLGNRQKSKTYINRKQSKNSSIPVFLMKAGEVEKASPEKKAYGVKQPSTERQYKEFKGKQQFYAHEVEKTGLNIISAKSIGESSDGGDTRSRKNTVNMLKDQLHSILQTPIPPKQRPISTQFENFKSSKIIYRSQPEQEQNSDKQQFNIIKEKVEQKKAKFAQLKNDARKILGDDF